MISGPYHFVDTNGLSDELSSMGDGEHENEFRQISSHRDCDCCVLTNCRRYDVTHIVSHITGDEVGTIQLTQCISHQFIGQCIAAIVNERQSLYEGTTPFLDTRIDSAANGLSLRKDLHVQFRVGEIAFLKVSTRLVITWSLLTLASIRLLTLHWEPLTSP
jgi:hypothetical protein